MAPVEVVYMYAGIQKWPFLCLLKLATGEVDVRGIERLQGAGHLEYAFQSRSYEFLGSTFPFQNLCR